MRDQSTCVALSALMLYKFTVAVQYLGYTTCARQRRLPGASIAHQLRTASVARRKRAQRR